MSGIFRKLYLSQNCHNGDQRKSNKQLALVSQFRNKLDSSNLYYKIICYRYIYSIEILTAEFNRK